MEKVKNGLKTFFMWLGVGALIVAVTVLSIILSRGGKDSTNSVRVDDYKRRDEEGDRVQSDNNIAIGNSVDRLEETISGGITDAQNTVSTIASHTERQRQLIDRSDELLAELRSILGK